MSTRVLSFLLALCLLWSAFLAAGVGMGSTAGAAGATGGEQRTVVAVGGMADLAQPHSGVPSDPRAALGPDSAGPDQHSPVDTALGEAAAPGMLEPASEPLAIFGSPPGLPAPPLSMAQPRSPAVAAWPAPHLDGPKRPPRPTALVG